MRLLHNEESSADEVPGFVSSTSAETARKRSVKLNFDLVMLLLLRELSTLLTRSASDQLILLLLCYLNDR